MPVRILTWWDYISDEAVQRLGHRGFRLEIIPYRTNEVAVSRLSHNAEKFDVAILSNVTIPILSDSQMLENDLNSIRVGRRYLPWIDKGSHCVPYLWSTTAFTYDKQELKGVPNSLPLMIDAAKQGYEVSIIDDAFEFAARYQIDFGVPKDGKFSGVEELKPSFFVSSIEPLLKKRKIITYGWHGESAKALERFPWLAISPGHGKIIVGYDAVCALKGSKIPLERLKVLIGVLTDRKSIAATMKMTQYFSPYVGHIEGLSPRVKELYDEVQRRIEKTPPIILGPREIQTYPSLNQAWRALRYGT